MATQEILRGNKTLSGTHGIMYLNDEAVVEFSEVTATITAEEEEVQLGLSKDRKIVALSGEGTATLKKVYSRGKKIIENWVKGKDPRSRLIFVLRDPDAVGGQEERVSIDNVWFKSVDLVKFTKGAAIEEEFPFGFTPEDVKYEGEIK